MQRQLVAWLPALLLAACASVPAPPAEPVAGPAVRWTLGGRIGIRTDTESLSGSLRWQHGPDADTLLLTSPLGQGLARIERRESDVRLEMPGQATRTAHDVETLTSETLGYALPVAGLSWWVQGLPDPGRRFDAVREDSGRLARLRQDGWTIDYLQYNESRPRKLVLFRDGLEIRLVADEWRAE